MPWRRECIDLSFVKCINMDLCSFSCLSDNLDCNLVGFHKQLKRQDACLSCSDWQRNSIEIEILFDKSIDDSGKGMWMPVDKHYGWLDDGTDARSWSGQYDVFVREEGWDCWCWNLKPWGKQQLCITKAWWSRFDDSNHKSCMKETILKNDLIVLQLVVLFVQKEGCCSQKMRIKTNSNFTTNQLNGQLDAHKQSTEWPTRRTQKGGRKQRWASNTNCK